MSDFYYVKVIELPGKAYILGEEVSLLHGFPRLRSHSRGLYITQLVSPPRERLRKR